MALTPAGNGVEVTIDGVAEDRWLVGGATQGSVYDEDSDVIRMFGITAGAVQRSFEDEFGGANELVSSPEGPDVLDDGRDPIGFIESEAGGDYALAVDVTPSGAGYTTTNLEFTRVPAIKDSGPKREHPRDWDYVRLTYTSTGTVAERVTDGVDLWVEYGDPFVLRLPENQGWLMLLTRWRMEEPAEGQTADRPRAMTDIVAYWSRDPAGPDDPGFQGHAVRGPIWLISGLNAVTDALDGSGWLHDPHGDLISFDAPTQSAHAFRVWLGTPAAVVIERDQMRANQRLYLYYQVECGDGEMCPFDAGDPEIDWNAARVEAAKLDGPDESLRANGGRFQGRTLCVARFLLDDILDAFDADADDERFDESVWEAEPLGGMPDWVKAGDLNYLVDSKILGPVNYYVRDSLWPARWTHLYDVFPDVQPCSPGVAQCDAEKFGLVVACETYGSVFAADVLTADPAAYKANAYGIRYVETLGDAQDDDVAFPQYARDFRVCPDEEPIIQAIVNFDYDESGVPVEYAVYYRADPDLVKVADGSWKLYYAHITWRGANDGMGWGARGQDSTYVGIAAGEPEALCCANMSSLPAFGDFHPFADVDGPGPPNNPPPSARPQSDEPGDATQNRDGRAKRPGRRRREQAENP